MGQREAGTTILPSNAQAISQNTKKQPNNNRNTYNNVVDIGSDAINHTNRSVVRRDTPVPNLDVKTVFDYDDHHIAITRPIGSTRAATKFIFSTWTTPTMALNNDFAMWTKPDSETLRQNPQSITRQDPQSIINSTMQKQSLRTWNTILNMGSDKLEPFLKQKIKDYIKAKFTPENKTYIIIAICALVIALFIWVCTVYYCCYNLILHVRNISKMMQDSETTKCDADKCPYATSF